LDPDEDWEDSDFEPSDGEEEEKYNLEEEEELKESGGAASLGTATASRVVSGVQQRLPSNLYVSALNKRGFQSVPIDKDMDVNIATWRRRQQGRPSLDWIAVAGLHEIGPPVYVQFGSELWLLFVQCWKKIVDAHFYGKKQPLRHHLCRVCWVFVTNAGALTHFKGDLAHKGMLLGKERWKARDGEAFKELALKHGRATCSDQLFQPTVAASASARSQATVLLQSPPAQRSTPAKLMIELPRFLTVIYFQPVISVIHNYFRQVVFAPSSAWPPLTGAAASSVPSTSLQAQAQSFLGHLDSLCQKKVEQKTSRNKSRFTVTPQHCQYDSLTCLASAVKDYFTGTDLTGIGAMFMRDAGQDDTDSTVEQQTSFRVMAMNVRGMEQPCKMSALLNYIGIVGPHAALLSESRLRSVANDPRFVFHMSSPHSQGGAGIVSFQEGPLQYSKLLVEQNVFSAGLYLNGLDGREYGLIAAYIRPSLALLHADS
jgi:hypothetical protein